MLTVGAYLLSVLLALHVASVPTVYGTNVVAGRFVRQLPKMNSK